MEIIEQIQTLCKDALAPLNHVELNGVKRNETIDIDCSMLAMWEIDYKGKYKTIFNTQYDINGPAFYWFEIISPTDLGKIESYINTYVYLEDCKAFPAMKNKLDYNTKALYVGKVKNNFWNRIVQHLGFNPSKDTQGLQLFHWTAGLDLKLKLHVYEFETDMAGLMPIIENGMAKQLNPLLGKHLT